MSQPTHFNTEKIVQAVRHRMRESYVTGKDLSARTGYTEKHISQVLNRREIGSLEFWSEIFDVLGLTIEITRNGGSSAQGRLESDR